MKFKAYYKNAIKSYKDKGVKLDYYVILRNTLLKLYSWEIFFTFLMSLIAECSSVCYTYILGDMIKFLKDESLTDKTEGIKLIGIFVGLMFVA